MQYKFFSYYSAPGYPYRDFVIRFGLVWNFFS
ncbi:putative porin [Zobellia russellii]